jgi:TRAP-type mannitol/chloroaromatic compound transport system substrate-binding protein
MKNAGIGGLLAAGIAPAFHAQAAVRWRLASSFPKSLDAIYCGTGIFANAVKVMSAGKFEVSVHAGGELMPPFGVVDGVQGGGVEMAHTAPYYFYCKNPAFSLGSAIPFGLNARQMNAWIKHGNGRKLRNEFYAKYNMVSFGGGNTGAQMGGWFRKEIKGVEDFKGLKMRLGGGLVSEVMQKLGAVQQSIPGGEIFQALEKQTPLTQPSGSGRMTTKNWASTRLRLFTITSAGGRADPRSISSLAKEPSMACLMKTR